jgi:hypothetical protein
LSLCLGFVQPADCFCDCSWGFDCGSGSVRHNNQSGRRFGLRCAAGDVVGCAFDASKGNDPAAAWLSAHLLVAGQAS